MDLHSKRVLIFGVDSFTGKHLTRFLSSQGFEVFGTSLKEINQNNVFPCDITVIDQVISIFQNVCPHYVINLSGISFVGHAHKEQFFSVNVLGVENILEAAFKYCKDIRKIILASSATVYGNYNLPILSEELTPLPVNLYGISKLAMEHLARTYFVKLPVIVVRPFNYTGIGQGENFLIPKIVSHFKRKEQIIELGNTHVFREFNDVDFVCDVYSRLLMSDKKSMITNLASGRLLSLREIINQMESIAGYKIQVKVNPLFVRANEIESLKGSTQVLHSLIGEVTQVSLRETLEKMYNDGF